MAAAPAQLPSLRFAETGPRVENTLPRSSIYGMQVMTKDRSEALARKLGGGHDHETHTPHGFRRTGLLAFANDYMVSCTVGTAVWTEFAATLMN